MLYKPEYWKKYVVVVMEWCVIDFSFAVLVLCNSYIVAITLEIRLRGKKIQS